VPLCQVIVGVGWERLTLTSGEAAAGDSRVPGVRESWAVVAIRAVMYVRGGRSPAIVPGLVRRRGALMLVSIAVIFFRHARKCNPEALPVAASLFLQRPW
jgi:hypothetical protein